MQSFLPRTKISHFHGNIKCVHSSLWISHTKSNKKPFPTRDPLRNPKTLTCWRRSFRLRATPTRGSQKKTKKNKKKKKQKQKNVFLVTPGFPSFLFGYSVGVAAWFRLTALSSLSWLRWFLFSRVSIGFSGCRLAGSTAGKLCRVPVMISKEKQTKATCLPPELSNARHYEKKGGGGWVGLDGAMGKRLTWLASLIGFIGTYPRVSCRFRRRFRWGFPRLFVEFQFVWAPGRRRIDRPLTSSSTGPTEKKKLAATNGSGNRKDRLQSVGLLRFHSTLEGTLSLSFGIDVEENSTPSQRCSPRARRKSLFALEKEPKQVAVRHDQFFPQWKANFNRDASFFFIGKEAVIWLSIVARRDRWWQRRVPVRFPANAFSKQFPYNGDTNLSLVVKYFPIFI